MVDGLANKTAVQLTTCVLYGQIYQWIDAMQVQSHVEISVMRMRYHLTALQRGHITFTQYFTISCRNVQSVSGKTIINLAPLQLISKNERNHHSYETEWKQDVMANEGYFLDSWTCSHFDVAHWTSINSTLMWPHIVSFNRRPFLRDYVNVC